MNRLDKIEERIEQYPGELESRLNKQGDALADLRRRAAESESKAQETIRRMEARLTDIRAEVPAIIDDGISQRVEQLRHRLLADFAKQQETALSNFEAAIEARVAKTLQGIEAKLADQSRILAAISARSAETDGNLQRLIGAVQTLVDRSATEVEAKESAVLQPVNGNDASFLDLPFQAHLEHAIASSKEADKAKELSAQRRVPLAPLM